MIVWTAIAFLIFLTVMGLCNFFTALSLEDFDELTPRFSETVSVLIPARNEERNLPNLLRSLTRSRFRPQEILVLDDQSDDLTYDVAQKTLSEGDIPFRVLRGKPLDSYSAVTGKNHACQQLAEVASGDILLFCDADVTVSDQALGRTISMLRSYPQASGVSAFPSQNTIGVREKLVLPWVVQLPLILSVPLIFSWRTSFVSLQVANGQWMALRKGAYQDLGGHSGLGSEILDDVVLARKLAKMRKGPIIPVLAAHDIRVTMYSSWENLVEGFSKNMILLFGGTIPKFLLLLFFVNFLFFSPIWLLIYSWKMSALSVCLVMICRFLTGSIFLAPLGGAFSHFRSLVLLNILAVKIVHRNLAQQVHWKGRRLYSDFEDAT